MDKLSMLDSKADVLDSILLNATDITAIHKHIKSLKHYAKKTSSKTVYNAVMAVWPPLEQRKRVHSVRILPTSLVAWTPNLSRQYAIIWNPYLTSNLA